MAEGGIRKGGVGKLDFGKDILFWHVQREKLRRKTQFPVANETIKGKTQNKNGPLHSLIALTNRQWQRLPAP